MSQSELKPLPHKFMRYELTEEQYVSGSIFTQEQLAVLQNELAVVSDSLLELTFDSEHVLQYAQQEAELRGKMIMLSYLIDTSNNLSQQLTINTEDYQP